MRSNAKARQTKSRSRLQRYEEMAAEAEKTRKLDMEEIQIPPGPRLGNVVVEVEHLTKAFGDRILIDDLSFSLPRNGIVGVIGPNGVGKTTLFTMLVAAAKGETENKDELPTMGEIKVGDRLLSYVDQSRAGLDPAKNVWKSSAMAWTDQGGQRRVAVPGVCLGVRLQRPDQQKPAKVLSVASAID